MILIYSLYQGKNKEVSLFSQILYIKFFVGNIDADFPPPPHISLLFNLISRDISALIDGTIV